MKSYLEILNEIKKENEKYFKNYKQYAKIAKRIAEKEIGKVKVFVFGSVVKKQHTPASDIDLLIVSEKVPEKMKARAEIVAKILRRIGLLSPFEIHLINEREFKWYKKFIDKKIAI